MKRLLLFSLICISFLCCGNVLAQITQPTKFRLQNPDSTYTNSFLLGLPNNNFMFFWKTTNKILSSKSTDAGLSWGSANIVYQLYQYNFEDISIFLNAILGDSSKILLTFKNASFHNLIYSYDFGNSWSDTVRLFTGTNSGDQTRAVNSSLSKDLFNNLYLSYSKWYSSPTFDTNGVYFIKSTDNGNTWRAQRTVSSNGKNGIIIPIDSTTLWAIFENGNDDNSDIVKAVSTNGGQNWSSPVPFISSEFNEFRPRGFRDENGTLWIFYQIYKEALFNFHQPDIVYIKSTDNGVTWSPPESFTNYVGIDGWHNISPSSNGPLISFSSSRDFHFKYYFKIYYGIAEISADTSSPPYLYYSNHFPEEPMPGEEIILLAYTDDFEEITSVQVITKLNTHIVDTLEMFDDGLHNDSLPGDNIYGYIISSLNEGNALQYDFLITDNDNHTAGFSGSSIVLPFPFETIGYRIDVNDFILPVDNQGVLAEVTVNGESGGGRIDGKGFLFSGGFFLSGVSNGSLWANAVASASRIQDYQPGIIGSVPADPKNILYVVKADDPPFGESWLNWSYAVSHGADFYDGNGDSNYNPVDLNGNGTWDLDEDRPDLLGDLTVWCVYNDGVPYELRRFDVPPQGIEIQQTIFGVGNNSTGPIRRMLFIRYRFINRGLVDDNIDSVYFSGWADPDIGEQQDAYLDDLTACDTLFNAGYAYNQGEDNDWGVNPPAFFIKFLQGPSAYIPGETFIDNNMNGTFEDSIDTPLDTALVNNGLFIGSEILPGAKNLCISSFIHYMASHPELGDPNTHIEARNYMLGFNKFGDIIDPCNWTYGQVFGGIPCDQVNSHFWYSGDPVTQTGWINTFATDQRIMPSIGPFKLAENEPMDIWVTYIVGRGYDHLNSITKARDYSIYADEYYRSNFTTLPVDVKDEDLIIKNFILYQNYPNPFNPVTIIKYHLPELSIVSLKVFDILGQEVKTLVNKEQNAGSYEINFDASSLSSGIYFYELRTPNFSSVKKMILMK